MGEGERSPAVITLSQKQFKVAVSSLQLLFPQLPATAQPIDIGMPEHYCFFASGRLL